MNTKILTPADRPEHDVIGQFWAAHGQIWYCDSYDPRQGYWMTNCADNNLRRNVSERAPYSTFHKVRFGLNKLPFVPGLDITPEMMPAPYFTWPPKATMKRESGFVKELGRFPDNKWVARDEEGTYIDMDKYRSDLKERLEPRFYVVIEGD